MFEFILIKILILNSSHSSLVASHSHAIWFSLKGIVIRPQTKQEWYVSLVVKLIVSTVKPLHKLSEDFHLCKEALSLCIFI